ncbi:MAG: MFS transporter [Candidatus Solibacter sp.]|nr:MFS transporter [Candidatus Solibacter sp.]
MGDSPPQFGDDPALPLTAEIAPSRVPHTFRALRHRNFRLFIGGQIISLVGTWMQNVALSWLVYRLTHSELLLGTAWFCSQIAVFALGPLGGIAADRFSRQKVVIVTQTLSMVQAFVLAALTLSGRVQVWQVLVLAGLLGVINAFDMPGRQALVIQMTSKEDLINAISLNSAVFNAARVVGPAIAGVLLAVVGEGTCFLVNGFSFLAVILCLTAMRLPPATARAHAPMWQHLVDGFRYAGNHSAVRRVLALMGCATLSGMPGLVLMPFFADDIFHRGSRGGHWRGDRHADPGAPHTAVRIGQRDGIQRAHHRRLLPCLCLFPFVLFFAGHHAAHRLQRDAADGLGEHHHTDPDPRRVPRAHHGAVLHDGGRPGTVRQPGGRGSGRTFWRARHHGGRRRARAGIITRFRLAFEERSDCSLELRCTR